MPGSQPRFSLIPDPDENNEDTSFISVAACGVYVPIHVRFNSVFYQPNISIKMAKILKLLWNPGFKIRVAFCRFSRGTNNFIKEIPSHITHYSMVKQPQY